MCHSIEFEKFFSDWCQPHHSRTVPCCNSLIQSPHEVDACYYCLIIPPPCEARISPVLSPTPIHVITLMQETHYPVRQSDRSHLQFTVIHQYNFAPSLLVHHDMIYSHRVSFSFHVHIPPPPDLCPVTAHTTRPLDGKWNATFDTPNHAH